MSSDRVNRERFWNRFGKFSDLTDLNKQFIYYYLEIYKCKKYPTSSVLIVRSGVRLLFQSRVETNQLLLCVLSLKARLPVAKLGHTFESL